MLGLCILSLLTLSDAVFVLSKDTPLFVNSCKEGNIVDNECNQCICSEKHVYECTPKSTKACFQNNSPSLCQRNQMYAMDDIICICNKSGHWPHAKCDKIFKSFEFPAIKPSCKPNSYVSNDCNVCRCGPDGKIDKDHCTKNKCDNTKGISSNTRKLSQKSNVYGNCDVENWYSLAPCQFCYCINENKLVCNTGNVYARQLEIGAYNLSLCGQDLIQDAIELIPENQHTTRQEVHNKSITKELITTETPVKKPIDSNISIKVNSEGNGMETQIVENNNEHDYEYYTDYEVNKPIEREGNVTAPISDEEEESPNDINGQDSEQESGNEIPIEIYEPKPEDLVKKYKATEKESKTQQQTVKTLLENLNINGTLKFNIPLLLDKVFQMALRKSMVPVKKYSECTKGETKIIQCNICYCDNDNQLLCTTNPCN